LHVEAELLAFHIDDFPVLRSLVRSELYLSFILFIHAEIPAKEKTHDMKHIISAAYCNKFLSADNNQLKLVKQINPDLETIPWDAFANQIQPGGI
jgi:hypothetical protein